MMEFKLHNGSGGLCCKSCGRQDKQLNTYDWLADIPGNADESELVEVQFKNTRKGYFRNSNKIPLEKGDIVAVEATPGHDIGVVTLTGRLVPLQMKKANIKSEADIKRIYRKAKPVDMEKYNEAKAREHSTMIRSRQIALDLNLNMKIGDVEYQGDGNKAIFYYIADERVDFRQLIKVLADAFRVRIEMKQIGARQEAGRIGGIGPCGRELCCATWMTSFVSVSTSAARFQDISLNPQKLAGQCAKLKCCQSPLCHSQPGQQFFHRKGLCQVIIGTGIQRVDLIGVFAPGTDDDDGQIGPGADSVDDLHPVYIRQPQIQQNNIRIMRGRLQNSRFSVCRGQKPVIMGF